MSTILTARAVGMVFFRHATERLKCSFQTGGQRHKALPGGDDRSVTPAGMGKGELVQAVGERRTANLHLQLVGHREVGHADAPWRVLLGEVDLALSAKLGAVG